MATNNESRNETSEMPGRRPSFSRSIGQSLSAAFGKKDGYYFEIEFLSDTPTYHIGEKKQILVGYAEIGRSSNSTVRYKGEGIEKLVSGTHVSITRAGGQWTLEHLSKTNRTIINGGERTIRPEDSFKKYVLQDGDTVQLAKGGPVFRFTVPKENSIQSIRSKSRGTTFIRNLVSQALAPYKTKIRVLVGIIIAMGALFGAYAVWNYHHNEKVKKEYEEQLKRLRIENADEVAGLNQRIEEQAARIANQERRRVDTVRVPVRQPGLDEMLRQQNIAADVFFITAKVVAIVNGNEIPVPYYYDDGSGRKQRGQYGWTATGFLLNDGTFVTARHCIEGWWYSIPYNDTTQIAQSARASVSGANIKLKTYIDAYSSKSNRHLSFTSDQFHMDRSKDRVATVATTEDGSEIKWRFVFPALEGWDQSMFATDWAYVRTQYTGTLQADASLSNNLSSQQQLLVMGFPAGLGVESATRIEPISYQMQVTQSGIAGNGCIMHSRGTDHGNSGGPIFAVKDNKLVVVGIVSRGDHRSSMYNWAIPISRIGNR